MADWMVSDNVEAPTDLGDITPPPEGGKISESSLIFRRRFIYPRQTGVKIHSWAQGVGSHRDVRAVCIRTSLIASTGWRSAP